MDGLYEAFLTLLFFSIIHFSFFCLLSLRLVDKVEELEIEVKALRMAQDRQ